MNKPQKMKKKEGMMNGIRDLFECGNNSQHDEWVEYFRYLLSKIPSSKLIEKSTVPKYASAYYQGKFDILMDLIGDIKNEKN